MTTHNNAKEALRKASKEFHVRPKRTAFELHAKMLERRFHDIKRRPQGKPLGDTNEPFFDKFEPIMATGVAFLVLLGVLIVLHL